MRIIVLIAIYLSISFGCAAQEDIKSVLSEYLKLSEEKNSERLMDYMYPKFFELFPRQVMIEALDKSLKDPTLEIELKDSKILGISPTKTVDTVTYSIVDYAFVMTLKYVESEENPLPDKDTIGMTTNIFKNMYGDVSYDAENYRFTIKVKKNMLVLKTPSLKSWKVLGTDANLKPYMLKIIPKEIVDEL